MVSHDKKLYNNLVQMAMLASLLRLQPELGVPESPPDADLILGQSWAHTAARTAHAQLEHAAHRKNIDNVVERYQEELFEELHALGRFQRVVQTRPSHIQAYQLLGGDAEPQPEPEPPAANSSAPVNVTESSDRPPDEDLELDLELGLERLERRLEAGLELPPPPEFDVWDMVDADLAEAAELGRDAAEDFIQADVDASDEDAEPVEVLLRQDMTLAGPRRTDTPAPDPALSGSCCSPEPLEQEEDSLGPLKPQQQAWVADDDWLSLEAGNRDLDPDMDPDMDQDMDQDLDQYQNPDPDMNQDLDHDPDRDLDEDQDWDQSPTDWEEEEGDENEDALRHLWDRINTPGSPETAGPAPPTASEAEETEEEGPGPASPRPGRRRQDSLGHGADKVRCASCDDSGQGSSAESEEAGDAELTLLDEMLETVRRRPDALQGRLPFIRTMSMEQRWQDLASLLSLPAQEAAGGGMSHAHQQMLAHHPAYPYGGGYPAAHHPDMARSVLLQNASLAPPPPAGPPPAATELATNGSGGYPSPGLGSVSHLGSAVVSSMNLTTDGLSGAGPAATSAPAADMMYYQSGAPAALASAVAVAAAEPPPPPPPPGPAAPPDGGFLSQILGVDELQLMEMPMADGHPEWPPAATSSSGDDHFTTPPASDYAKVSQAHRLHEYGGYRTAAAAASPTVPAGPPPDSRAASLPSAQLKKHQFFGKRYFQGADGAYAAAGGSALPPGSPTPATPLKYPSYGAEGGLPAGHAYPPATPSAAAAAAALDSSELKYSCSMDFMRGHPADRMGLVSHNHSYHLPTGPADGPSGVQRPVSRDKHGDRPKEHLTRDEKRARSMAIPLSNDDIIHLPMDEFNERLSKHDLTEAQLSLIRDIRRRGKNKLAAQNCRKRKLDQILTLAEEVQRAKDQKQQTLADHQFLLQERGRIKEKYSQLYRHVFQSLRDPEGAPYSPLEYSLQQSADGSILLVPRNTTSGAAVEPDPSTGARRKQRDPPQ